MAGIERFFWAICDRTRNWVEEDGLGQCCVYPNRRLARDAMRDMFSPDERKRLRIDKIRITDA